MPPLRFEAAFAIVLVFVVAAIVVRIAHAIIHRLLGSLDIVGVENREVVHARAKQLIRALTLLAYGVAAIASVSLALARFGVGESGLDLRVAARWTFTHGLNVVIILIGAVIVTRVVNLAIDHLQFKLARTKATTDLECQRRATTLRRILTSLVTAVVGFMAILMLLRELAIDVVPILTGAGIAGLAVGFGAQNLVRDVISGFFLILEDQVRIGDLARINGIAGTVEQIKLRTILLRDGEARSTSFRTARHRAGKPQQAVRLRRRRQGGLRRESRSRLGTMREVGTRWARSGVGSAHARAADVWRDIDRRRW
jgi:small conductance mechanosensitive channel